MDFVFPVPPGYSEHPVWTGQDFAIGNEKVRFLRYTRNDEGWCPELTDFHEKEDEDGSHYTDRASRLNVLFELEKNLRGRKAVILEIGISSGYLIGDIRKQFPDHFLIGSDCIPEPLEKTSRQFPDIPLVQFDLVHCPLPDACVDVVIALNVLEHIRDDGAALRQIFRILKPGGYAILEVPSNPDLFDFYDEQLRHFRRYDLAGLSGGVKQSGFRIIKASHLGFFVYPGFFLLKRRNKKKVFTSEEERLAYMKDLLRMGGPVTNRVMYYLMLVELHLGKIIPYPAGIRCILTLQKPGS